MENLLLDKFNYWIFITLMMLGLWAMISKKNLIKKVIGMSIFQSAVILFYVSIGAKQSSADIPIYPHDVIHSPVAAHAASGANEEDLHHSEAAHAEPVPGMHASPNPTLLSEQVAHAEEGKSHDPEAAHASATHETHPKIASKINPDDYDNPIPHVLMLTAIVVGVATLGVALALIQRIFRLYGSIEEDEVIRAIAKDTSDDYIISPLPLSSVQSEKNSAHA